jgi:hypothetical protein
MTESVMNLNGEEETIERVGTIVGTPHIRTINGNKQVYIQVEVDSLGASDIKETKTVCVLSDGTQLTAEITSMSADSMIDMMTDIAALESESNEDQRRALSAEKRQLGFGFFSLAHLGRPSTLANSERCLQN